MQLYTPSLVLVTALLGGYFAEAIPQSGPVAQAIDNISSFVMYNRVKSSWIAFYVLWLLWLVLWGADLFVRGDSKSLDDGRNMQTNEGGERAGATSSVVYSTRSRVKNAYKCVRDVLFGLLGALTLNTFGIGFGRSVEVLSWLIVGLTVIWIALELAFNSRYARGVMGFLVGSLLLVITILAFAGGWD